MSKKGVLALVGGLILAAGVLLCIVAVLGLRFDVRAIGSTAPSEKKTYQIAGAALSDITVEDVRHAIRVQPSQDGDVHITYYENEREYYTFGDSDKAVYMKSVSNWHWYEFWRYGSHKDESVVIEIPDDFAGGLHISTVNGAITVTDVALGGEMVISTTAGAVEVQRVRAAGDVQASSTHGVVRLDDVAAHNEGGSASLQASTTNGEVSFDRVQADASLSGHTVNGAITLSGVKADNIQLRTVNGKVAGTIIGAAAEYTIRSQTTHGKNTLPTHAAGGEKKLDVETVNGAIDITFVTP